MPGRREPRVRHRLKRYAAALSKTDPSAARFLTPRRLEKLRTTIAQHDPDLVVFGHTILAPAISATEGLRARVILDTHNVESVLARRIANQRQSAVARWTGRLHASYLARFERTWLPRFGGIWAVSQSDADWYAKHFPKLPQSVVPNIVDTDRYDWRRPGDPGVITFCGWYRHWPNQDAAKRLIDISQHLLAQSVPHRMQLVGRDAPVWLREEATAAPAVDFVGEVADTAPYLARSSLVVAPIFAGSGSNLKVIEGMAAGRAVVTTPLGAQGISKQSLPLVIAEDAPAMIKHIKHYLDNPSASQRLGLQARAWVERNMSQHALSKIVRDAVDNVAPPACH